MGFTINKKVNVTPLEKETPQKKETKKNSLPPDSYQDMIAPIKMFLTEKTQLHATVKRMGDLGLPYADLRIFVVDPDPEKYSGPTKKGLSFELGMVSDVIELLQKLEEACEEEGLE